MIILFAVIGLLKWIHKLYWIPFAMAYRHRNFLSHSVFGTVVRAVLTFLVPLGLVMKATDTTMAALPEVVMFAILCLFYGMAFNDTMHLVSDSLHTPFRLRRRLRDRRRRRKRRRRQRR